LKIPKRVNAALDWMGRNVRMVAAVGAALIISIVIWSWVPELSALVLGVAIGGAVVHQRMASRQAALRSDIDDLLRQNGALRREKLTLASGVLAKQTQLTAKLPVIPEDSPAGGDTGDQPGGPAARTDPTAHTAPSPPADPDPAARAKPSARVDPKAPDAEALVNPATRTQPEVDAPSATAESPAARTAMFPAVSDDAGNQPAGPANATRADPPARAKRPAIRPAKQPSNPQAKPSAKQPNKQPTKPQAKPSAKQATKPQAKPPVEKTTRLPAIPDEPDA